MFGVVAEVEFVDERRVDVHLVLAEPEPVDLEGPGRCLTRRERAVIGLIAKGLETQEIADTLYVSTATVKTHVNRAMAKLGAVIISHDNMLKRMPAQPEQEIAQIRRRA